MISTFMSWLVVQATTNQFFIGMIIPAVGTACFFLFGRFWAAINKFVTNWFTINITMNSDWENYPEVSQFLYNNNVMSFFQRSFHIGLSKQKHYGDDDFESDGKSSKYKSSLGYGNSLARFGRFLGVINRRKEESSATKEFKESITITIFCMVFNRKTVREKITKYIESSSDLDKIPGISVKNVPTDEWSHSPTIRRPLRPMESVFIPKDQKDYLIRSIKTFLNNEELHNKRSIPWTLGIVLYGPPGTGKTSIIQALATEFEKDVQLLKSVNLSSIDPHAFNCIEDIDRDMMGKLISSKVKNTDDTKFVSSNMLNHFDGMLSKHGTIFIITTNNIEDLDPALLRPGRFDIRLEIGLMEYEQFVEMCEYYEIDIPIDEDKYRKISPSKARELVLYNTQEEIESFFEKDI